MKERNGKRYKLFIQYFDYCNRSEAMMDFNADGALEIRKLRDFWMKEIVNSGCKVTHYFITKWNSKLQYDDIIERGDYSL